MGSYLQALQVHAFQMQRVQLGKAFKRPKISRDWHVSNISAVHKFHARQVPASTHVLAAASAVSFCRQLLENDGSQGCRSVSIRHVCPVSSVALVLRSPEACAGFGL